MENEKNIVTVNIGDLWDIFVRRLWIIILAAAIGIAAVFAYTRLMVEPKYSSTATMYILRQSNEELSAGEASSDFSLALKVVNDCTYLLKSRTVLDQAIADLKLDVSYSELYKTISTVNPSDTRILEVTVQADTPEKAKAIVDSICTIGAVRINDAMGYDQVNLYELGKVNTSPSNATGLMTYAFVGIVIAILTYAVFLVIYLFDNSIRSDEDIERYLGLTVIGDIPDANGTKKRGYGKYGYGYGAGRRKKDKGATEEDTWNR